jgi:hypothetical protein
MSSSSLTQLNTANGAIEGWRAVLSVVLRYGIGHRQRISTAKSYLERAAENLGSGSSPVSAAAQPHEDIDGIDAMMAGVKSHGVYFLSFCY